MDLDRVDGEHAPIRGVLGVPQVLEKGCDPVVPAFFVGRQHLLVLHRRQVAVGAAPPRVSLATPARPLLTGDSHLDRLDPPARASAHITQRSPAPPLGGGSLTRPPDDLLPRRRTHTWA